MVVKNVEQVGVLQKSAAIDHSLTGDGNVHQIFAPDQAIMKMGVPAILIAVTRERVRRIVGLHSLRRAEDA